MQNCQLIVALVAVAHSVVAAPQPAAAVPSPGCTTTITSALPGDPAATKGPGCTLDHLEHIWPATVTTTATVDCHGCNHVVESLHPIFHCPVNIISSTTTETTATTEFTVVCSPSP